MLRNSLQRRLGNLNTNKIKQAAQINIINIDRLPIVYQYTTFFISPIHMHKSWVNIFGFANKCRRIEMRRLFPV